MTEGLQIGKLLKLLQILPNCFVNYKFYYVCVYIYNVSLIDWCVKLYTCKKIKQKLMCQFLLIYCVVCMVLITFIFTSIFYIYK